jgi:glycyl-tRNA synthetase (class II)
MTDRRSNWPTLAFSIYGWRGAWPSVSYRPLGSRLKTTVETSWLGGFLTLARRANSINAC